MQQLLTIGDNDSLRIDGSLIHCATLYELCSHLDSEGLTVSKTFREGCFELDSLVYCLTSKILAQLMDKRVVTVACQGSIDEIKSRDSYWDNVNEDLIRKTLTAKLKD